MSNPSEQNSWFRSVVGSELGTSAQQVFASRMSTDVNAKTSTQAHRAAFAELTGRPDGPPAQPTEVLVGRVNELAALLSALIDHSVDGFRCLTERSSFVPSLVRGGSVSCGGATRLVTSSDSAMAIALSRVSDFELLPALLSAGGDHSAILEESVLQRAVMGETADERLWADITAIMARQPARLWVEQAKLLGLAVSELAETGISTEREPAVRMTPFPSATAGLNREAPLVVDLSSLWAGPLCSRFLLRSGMRVVKVEDPNRPDGGRIGSPEFFGALHEGKALCSIDFGSASGRNELRSLLMRADIVIEGSRPRALAALGIDAEEVLREGQPRVWVSLTGHGRTDSDADRVGFGDDAAVAGGLVHWEDGVPLFLGDAIADPLTGMVAAASAMLAWQSVASGEQTSAVLLDVAMARVAAAFSSRSAGPSSDRTKDPR